MFAGNLPLGLLVLTIPTALFSPSHVLSFRRMRRTLPTFIVTDLVPSREGWGRRFMTMASAEASHRPQKVAVLGAGAAGLVTGRLFHEAGFRVRIFEKTSTVGGVWKYRPEDVVYRSLVTNLPKEIMAFLDTPFDPSLPSFLRHTDVQTYLEGYAKQYDVEKLITFDTEVKEVRPVRRTRGQEGEGAAPYPPGDYTREHGLGAARETGGPEGVGEEGEAPMWRVTVVRQAGGSVAGACEGVPESEVFDAVVVCNGHYQVPHCPDLPGLREHYRGRVMHSRDYDHPEALRGLKVLCVGYRASGTDIAREVAQVASEVHVVDRRLSKMTEDGKDEAGALQRGNIYRRPGLRVFLPGGDGKSAMFEDGSVCTGIDLVLYCTGFQYHMPFLSGGSAFESRPLSPSALLSDARLLRVEDRAVFPLYQHLFHAFFPSLVFIGLLHSVVPFPLFELQARWALKTLRQPLGSDPPPPSLPPRRRRFQWLEEEKMRQEAAGRVLGRDWFFLGPGQWAYKRLLAREAGCLTSALEEDLQVREGIYNDVSNRRPVFPGGSDAYRRCEYRRVAGGEGWEVEVGEKGSFEGAGEEKGEGARKAEC